MQWRQQSRSFGVSWVLLHSSFRPQVSCISPGFATRERNFQKFVYLLMEVCKARRIDFIICAPNLRVPTSSCTYLAYMASISEVVQSLERYGNSQLTKDDAIFYDPGMSMSRLTFDQQGRRLTREATATEGEQFAAITG